MARKINTALLVPVLLVMGGLVNVPEGGTRQNLRANEFYVSPTGNGNGAITSPWGLQQALNQSAGVVRPGSTIWVRGGTYRGSFRSNLVGSVGAPIIVRNYANERATIDTGNLVNPLDPGLLINGSDTWFWGLEITHSGANRLEAKSCTGNGCEPRNTGVSIYGDRIKLINCILHDGANEVLYKFEADNSELYGCLIYNNGWYNPKDTTGGNLWTGHAIYFESRTGSLFADNIVFGSFGYNVHAFSQTQGLQGYNITGNTVVGKMGKGGAFLFRANGPVSGVVIKENYLYSDGFGMDGGPANGDASLTDNYVYAESFPLQAKGWQTLNIQRNTFVRMFEPSTAETQLWRPAGVTYTINNNAYFSGPNVPPVFYIGRQDYSFTGWRGLGYDLNGTGQTGLPQTNAVFVRPNQYEAGRYNVTVYNWQNSSSISIKLPNTGTVAGQRYEVRNAFDFYAAPVATGVFSPGSTTISVPLSGLSVAQPIGGSTVGVTNRLPTKLRAFVVIKQ